MSHQESYQYDRYHTITIYEAMDGHYAYTITAYGCTSTGTGYPTAEDAKRAAEQYVRDGGC